MTTLRQEVGPFKAVGEYCYKTPAKRLAPKSPFLLKLEQHQQKQRVVKRQAPGGSQDQSPRA